jgi:hypothetical protein
VDKGQSKKLIDLAYQSKEQKPLCNGIWKTAYKRILNLRARSGQDEEIGAKQGI